MPATLRMMHQVWRNLTFLHWRYDPQIVAQTLPGGLTLDTFDGSAWIGLVPFELADVQLLGLPAIPWLCTFPETNVRTYVLGPDGKPGVWFYTLDASRLLPVLAARAWYKLPYHWARMGIHTRAGSVDYQSSRHAMFGAGSTDVAIKVGESLVTQDLDHFLTARFRLYAANGKRIGYANIEHAPWPLQTAQVTRLEENLITNCGLPAPKGDPIVHFSRELRVSATALRWF